LLYWQLAYTNNFGLHYRTIDHAYFYFTGIGYDVFLVDPSRRPWVYVMRCTRALIGTKSFGNSTKLICLWLNCVKTRNAVRWYHVDTNCCVLNCRFWECATFQWKLLVA